MICWNWRDVSVVFGSGKEEFFEWDGQTQTHAPVDVRVRSTLTFDPNPLYSALKSGPI